MTGVDGEELARRGIATRMMDGADSISVPGGRTTRHGRSGMWAGRRLESIEPWTVAIPSKSDQRSFRLGLVNLTAAEPRLSRAKVKYEDGRVCKWLW